MANVKQDFSVEEKLTSLVQLQKVESKMDEIHIVLAAGARDDMITILP